MPLSYPTGTVEEHLACRQSVAMFDVSHLGTVRVTGPDAFAVLQESFTNDLSKIGPGRAQYTHLLDEKDGSVLDDLIVWWVSSDSYDVMPNASNTLPVLEALWAGTAQEGRQNTQVSDVTAERAVIAVQGPKTRELLEKCFPGAAGTKRMRVSQLSWNGLECTVAGTGYTGEDGVEIAVPAGEAERIWSELLAGGAVPAGLGARDTLRLEAGLPLHGHELGPGITPLQVGLGWVVGWDKSCFRGRSALAAERDRGVSRHLLGLVSESRQPLRQGAGVIYSGSDVGAVTSGSFSPMLERGIGLALVHPSIQPGEQVEVQMRNRLIGAEVVKPPFIKMPARGESS